jgi:hypothetical protein
MEMKVYMNKYKYHWLSPYTICEKICWWREIDYDEPWVKQVVKVLDPVMILWQDFLDFVDPKINYVKIDPWDTWSMDSTLTPIILPMLKQLREHKHGAPSTEDEDVPANLRSTTPAAQKAKKESWDSDGNHFKRWDWIMDEMIWAFEQLADDSWEEQYFTGKSDIVWVPSKELDANGRPLTYEMKKGPGDTRKYDKKGYAKHSARIDNGLRLFGKYFRALWD